MQNKDNKSNAGARSTLLQLLSELSATETAPPQVLKALQDSKLRALSAHHVEHTPSFRTRLERANLGSLDLANLQLLPPITRRGIQDEGQAFMANSVPPQHQPLGKIKTSGSTGEPVELTKTAFNQMLWSRVDDEQVEVSMPLIKAVSKLIQTMEWVASWSSDPAAAAGEVLLLQQDIKFLEQTCGSKSEEREPMGETQSRGSNLRFSSMMDDLWNKK